MKHLFKVLGLAIPLSFLIGFSWVNYKKAREQKMQSEGLRLVTRKGFIPEGLRRLFVETHKIPIQVVEVENEGNLLEEVFEQYQKADLFQIPSFDAREALEADVLRGVDRGLLGDLRPIHSDFKGLNFDPRNHFLVPVAWGILGFLANSEKVKPLPNTVEDVLSEWSGHVSLIAHPSSLLFTLSQGDPQLEALVKEENFEGVRDFLRDMKENLFFEKTLSLENMKASEIWLAQTSAAEAQPLASGQESFKFIVPEGGGYVWVDHLAISNHCRNVKLAHEFMNFLLSRKVQEKWMKELPLGSVLSSDLDLPKERQASYLRSLELKKIAFKVDHRGRSATWQKSLQVSLPEHFSDLKVAFREE